MDPRQPESVLGAGALPEPSTLEEAITELTELRRRIREGASPDPVVHVDHDGRVTAVLAWPWSDPPTIGQPFAELFGAESRAALVELAERGWIGLFERQLAMRDRTVSLSAAREGDGYRVALHDVTARQLLDRAAEQRRRMRALADLAGSLARELTDPMSIVQGRLELLLDLGVSEPDAVRRHLGVALDHARRVTATLRNLRLVGRTAEPSEEPVRVEECVHEALDLLGPRRDQVLVRIEPPEICFGCDGALTARVIASLLRQSLESSGRGPVHLRAKRERTVVRARIGPRGRAGEDVTVDGDELALDRTLVASVGGLLGARRVGTALQFELVLPTPSPQRARRRSPQGRLAVVGGTTVRQAIPALLSRDGYEFVTAQTAKQALELLDRESVDVVIAELLLDGGASGLTLAEWLGQPARPSRPRMVLLYEGMLPELPAPLVPLRWPVGRAELLDVLQRVRR